jgi:mannose PTS system EIIA component
MQKIKEVVIMSLKIVILTHGNMAEGLLDASRLFFDTSCLRGIGLHDGDDIDAFSEKVEQEIADAGFDEVLILTDIVGGTPFNQASRALLIHKEHKRIELLTGVNLPMLLEIGMNIERPLQELKQAGLDAAKSGVMDLRQIMHADV